MSGGSHPPAGKSRPMCAACFEQDFPRFASWQAFESFEHALRLRGLVWCERLGNWPARELFALRDPAESRQCRTCGQVWALSLQHLLHKLSAVTLLLSVLYLGLPDYLIKLRTRNRIIEVAE